MNIFILSEDPVLAAQGPHKMLLKYGIPQDKK